jgi:NAD(P)-dependent dehydrogenase (short-subunit alcohol dehydrogenase family)
VDLNLENKVVLVTGAGRGVNAAVAKAFCAEGSRVIFVDQDPEGAAAMKGFEELATFMRCDLSDRA